MDKETARKIADALTWSRIFSVVPITVLAWYGFKWWVFAIYLAASLTDFFDGFFARRAAPPASDLDFDGLADLLFAIMTLFWLWFLIPGFFPKYWLPYLPVLLLLEIYITSARMRYPDLTVPHLEFGRKAMALFYFMLPVLIIWNDVPWFVHLVFITVTAAVIQLTWVVARSVRPEQVPESAAGDAPELWRFRDPQHRKNRQIRLQMVNLRDLSRNAWFVAGYGNIFNAREWHLRSKSGPLYRAAASFGSQWLLDIRAPN